MQAGRWRGVLIPGMASVICKSCKESEIDVPGPPSTCMVSHRLGLSSHHFDPGISAKNCVGVSFHRDWPCEQMKTSAVSC